MDPLSQLEEVLAGDDLSEIHDVLIACLYLFESMFGNESLAGLVEDDWPAALQLYPLSERSARELKRILKGVVDRESLPCRVRSFAASVMGASGDFALKPFLMDRFVSEMKEKRRHELIYSLMTSLVDLGERPFSRTSRSFLDEKENMADADAFLARILETDR